AVCRFPPPQAKVNTQQCLLPLGCDQLIRVITAAADPAVALNQGAVGIVPRSGARGTADALVGMYAVAKAPASSCALSTDPVTVSVSVPAVGVNVSATRAGNAPVPTNGPAVDTPLSVTVPVP